MSLGFWNGKRILLTGHTGFKGTWMSLMLENLGAVVCGYSLPVNQYSFYSKVRPQSELHIEADIADSSNVLRVVESFKPEIIFHFASHSSLDGSLKIPDFILRTNMMGVLNVLEAARKCECVRTVLIVTSDKCYKNVETKVPYREDSPLGAQDPYSTSKVCQELLTACYMETFFQGTGREVGIATARASNVIGAGDYNITRLLPYLLECFSSGCTPQIRNPHAVRPWQYVLDVLYGYLLLAEKLYREKERLKDFDGAYNFGPLEDGFAEVGYVVDYVSKCFGNAAYVVKSGQDQIKKESNILKLDSTKSRNILGWIPCKTLNETLSTTVEFVKTEKTGVNVGIIARDLVKSYLCEVTNYK